MTGMWWPPPFTAAPASSTFNLKVSAGTAQKPYNLTAQHPDGFIFDLLDLRRPGFARRKPPTIADR